MAYSAIDKATSFAESKIYTGTGSSQSITGLGFEPDFTWIKVRSQGYGNRWFDTVRGATKYIQSNGVDGEGTDANSLSAWTSDGFTVISALETNANTEKYVSWNWKMGTTTGLSGGTITPTAYSFNTTAAQSVIAYTGTGSAATVPHGLGVAPSLIITKSLVATQEWCVYHKSLGATKYLFLNETSAAGTGSSYWNDVEPTSSVFSIGTAGPTNSSSAMIAYCFADVKGYSRMGSYEGSGDADGPFVYTGFKPSFVMIKNSSSVLNWTNRDNARDTFNPGYNYIYPNLNNAGTNIGPPATSGSYPVDFYSTGFKINNTDTKINEAQSTFVYAAFGQTIVGTNGVVGTAR